MSLIGTDPRHQAQGPVWTMLADAGIDLDRIDIAPDGSFVAISIDGTTSLVFGEDRGEDDSDGWSWTTYDHAEADGRRFDYVTGSDGGPDDDATCAAMLRAIRRVTGS